MNIENLPLFSSVTAEEIEQKIEHIISSIGQEHFVTRTVSGLLSLCQPERCVPDRLHRFSKLICDGIGLFLENIPFERLKQAILNQTQVDKDATQAERLFILAAQFPTLQKLAQIVARDTSLDQEVRDWLSQLEMSSIPWDSTNQYLATVDTLGELIGDGSDIQLSQKILASASVANVITFSVKNENTQKHGVFKVLKPDIKKILKDELNVLEKVVTTLGVNREDYGLEELKLNEILKNIKEDLVREVELEVEQENLLEAARQYGSLKNVVIPELTPYCNGQVTGMEFIKGGRITDFELDEDQRLAVAQLVFETMICAPFFSQQEAALFHGDPHAGNIFAIQNDSGEVEQIALLDWTLAGRLTRETRLLLLRLSVALLCRNWRDVKRALSSLKEELSTPLDQINTTDIFMQLKGPACEETSFNPLRESFLLLERLTMAGMLFPPELTLFRKSFFTLEGVLQDISGEFDIGKSLNQYLVNVVYDEFPQRMLVYPGTWFDQPEDYRSMLSNKDLILMMLSQHQRAIAHSTFASYRLTLANLAMVSGDYLPGTKE